MDVIILLERQLEGGIVYQVRAFPLSERGREKAHALAKAIVLEHYGVPAPVHQDEGYTRYAYPGGGRVEVLDSVEVEE